MPRQGASMPFLLKNEKGKKYGGITCVAAVHLARGSNSTTYFDRVIRHGRPLVGAFRFQKEGEARGGHGCDGQNCAGLTLETLVSTPSGVTSPATVTFLLGMSMSNDVTPSILAMCFFTLPAQPLQCSDTRSTTTCVVLAAAVVEDDRASAAALCCSVSWTAVISDDDEAEEDVPDDEDSAWCTVDGGASLAKGAGREASAGNASMKDGGGGFPSPPGNASMKDGGGGGGNARTSRSSDCSREELRRNLEEVAGLTSLFSEDLVPPLIPAAPAVVLFFFFLVPWPCSWCWESSESAESLVVLLVLGLGGLEVEERCGSRSRGEWRSMARPLLPTMAPVPVEAMMLVASAEEQEMEMEGRPRRLCTPLRSRDAMERSKMAGPITLSLSPGLGWVGGAQ
ncbi:hypothetical protein VPH35_048276 [Triticum aestivum]